MLHHRLRLLAFLLLSLAFVADAAAISLTDQIKWPPGLVPVGQTNGPDTLDDIWQGQFNAWALDPNGDEDKDGCSNIVESIAGTNPFLANDCFKIGDMVISGGAVVFTAKVEAGKKYRVLSADSPGSLTWSPETLQTPVNGVQEYVPSADQTEAFISITKPADSKKFYKLETSDVDTNGDGVSDWVARKLGLNPNATDSNGDGVSDADEITQELQTQDTVTVGADNAFASEDGGPPGMLRLRRNHRLLGATIYYTIGGTAAAADYVALTGSVHFAPGSKDAYVAITPNADASLEGGESVTVTLTSGTTDSSAPLLIGGAGQASVIINNTTAAGGTGLLARYYDNASSTYAHAANFGDFANYAYTRSGSSPNYTGSVVVTPTGLSAQRLADILAAISVGTQVKLTFNGGNLNTTAYNHFNYPVASKTATTFTCTLPSGASLPASSSSNCYFSIQSVPHPAVITRVDANINNEWMGGTPNGVAVAAAAGTTATNVPDNYSDTFEMYLSPANAGSYRFQLDADDKARVLLDQNGDGIIQDPAEQILEHGWDTAATASPEDGVADDEVIGTFKISSSISLSVPGSPAQRYLMRVEHVETTGEARCRLQWSRNGGSFANIPQAEQLTHTQAATYAFTRGAPVTTGTATISLTSHGLSVGNPVMLAFSSGNLFTPNSIDLNGYNGTYTVATVPDANSFTVTVNSTGSTLPSNQSAGASCFLENRPASTTTGVYNKTYTNTTFSNASGRIGVDAAVTTSNNGLWGTGTPDVNLINPDTFTVRWTGQVQPQFTEEYTFVVQADDGCSLWINGQPQELKMFPAANSSGSTYIYNRTTGNTIVNYANSVLKFGSVAVGESARLDPSSGNLSNATGSTYTYDSSTGDMVVDYSNLTNITAGSYIVGETVEVDPTTGSVNLGQLPYTITAVTATTFTVNIGANQFASGSGSINVSDNINRLVTTVYPAGTGTYSYTSGTGDTVIDYSVLGFPANAFQVGQNVFLDPTSGNLSSQAYATKVITAATATTFTVNYGTSFTTGTGSIAMIGVDVPIGTGAGQVPAGLTGAFVVNLGAGKYTDGSLGNMNFDFLNKPFKDWSSNGNERFVRLPMLGGARYDIRLEYWESSGFTRCKLFWFSPSQPRQIIPTERLYPAEVPLAPPSHVSATDVVALVGGAVSIPVTASNGAAASLSGVPPWLTYNGGVLSGTPPANAVGDYQILVTITDANGTTKSLINLHVENTGGTIVREQWDGVSGTTVADIPTGNAPSSTSNLTLLQGPTDAADDYGARIRGYITAPTTGNYYFWIASSNAAELWVSNDDEPVNAFKRAWVSTGTAAQEWNNAGEPNQKSPWLALVEGKRYYIEILHKAGVGSDHLAVGWAKPGQSGGAPAEIVPGYVLTSYTPPAPGSTPGTLYVASMLSQGGAATNGVGTSTLRLSADESYAIMRYSYSGLTGSITSQHIHTDPYLTHASTIVYDIDTPATPGDGLISTGPDAGAYKWTITPVGTLSTADIREIIKQGKAYINLHTAMYPAGEIRGNYTLAAGSRTFTPPPAPLSWTDDSDTNEGAVRFLAQATFGANIADIDALQALTPAGGKSRYELWIEDQFTKPASVQLPEVLARELSDAGGGAQFDETLTFNAWWRNSISGADQLRQRIAFALSETLVVSAQGPLDNRADALSYYYDRLAANAFGSFRDILKTVTLTPTMGRYLDMLRNDKPDQSVGRIPNENYAREIKQLFSIGLFRMWPDGSLILDSSDSPIDTYTQREIIGFAHVFTGWDYGYDGAPHTSLNAITDWTRQMRDVPARHYVGQKRLLNNVVLPGLTTAGGQPLDPLATHNSTQYNDSAYQALPAQELDAAHEMLFNHPNVGPFICRQLIQRLVTSHPSRDYLYRVVQKFNDNGSGVRGDMQAVIKAVLLDYEARSPQMITIPAFGKQREPVMRVAAAGRAFRLEGASGSYSQSNSHVINITGMPNKLAGGNSVFLEFQRSGSFVPGDTTPSSEVYTVLSTPAPTATSFSVNAKGWLGVNTTNGTTNEGLSGTYSQTAGSTTMTINISSHWLAAGMKCWLDFATTPTSGPAMTDGSYTVNSPATDSGSSNSFTITAPDTTARSGYIRMVRFQGSFTVSDSGLAAPQEKRITFDTIHGGIADHHLNVNDPVYLNFTVGNPRPTDGEFVVESVPDANTFTVLTSTAIATQGGANDADNGMYIFPLVSQPLSSGTGTVNGLPSTFAMGNTDTDINQTPLNSPTVFNFFLPDYKFPGTLASQGITTPEFQTTAETTVVRQANFLYNGLFNPGNTNGISSFKTGSNTLVLNFSGWMGAAPIADIGLGAPLDTTVPWTHNQNLLDTVNTPPRGLIDQLCTLLLAGQMSTQAKTVIKNFIATPVSSIATGTGCEVTTAVNHNLNTGDTVLISGVTNGSFSSTLNNTTTTRTITVTGPTTFRLNGTNSVNCTTSPNAAGLTNAHVSVVSYNQGTTAPSDTHKRDRLRAIIHLILTSPDFTIQR
ncbi:MAG: DUF1800 family protein [Verrucomicrobiaceae bacterium]